ncbi:MAG: hypothetical protein ACE5I7_12705 [Candidatus Binatia bacterium]
MKRPIAEFLTMALRAGSEAEHAHDEREAWQILRRKQGYVTHRIYQHASEPLQRLVYSEWESPKAAAGARQHLQATPLMRRLRGLLTAPPQRLVVELTGPLTSTKGLDLPGDAVAASALTHLASDMATWRPLEEQLWQTLSKQPGHITHVLFRGVDNRLLVGSFSHWADADSFQQALTQIEGSVASGVTEAVARPLEYVLYTPARD